MASKNEAVEKQITRKPSDVVPGAQTWEEVANIKMAAAGVEIDREGWYQHQSRLNETQIIFELEQQRRQSIVYLREKE